VWFNRLFNERDHSPKLLGKLFLMLKALNLMNPST
jgi:hypothetical protein